MLGGLVLGIGILEVTGVLDSPEDEDPPFDPTMPPLYHCEKISDDGEGEDRACVYECEDGSFEFEFGEECNTEEYYKP